MADLLYAMKTGALAVGGVAVLIGVLVGLVKFSVAMFGVPGGVFTALGLLLFGVVTAITFADRKGFL